MIQTLYSPFKHWSDGCSVWILGDPHFDDPDCKLMDPEWITPIEQIKRINEKVGWKDTFLCLGDVGDVGYIKDIHACRKILIAGNHDRMSECRNVFDEVYEGPLFISKKILLSHEPVDIPFGLNIHGHVHNRKEMQQGKLNLAANVCGYEPKNLERIIRSGAMSGTKTIHRVAIDALKDHADQEPEKADVCLTLHHTSAENLAGILKDMMVYMLKDAPSDPFAKDQTVTFFDLYRTVERQITPDEMVSLSLTRRQAVDLAEGIEQLFYDLIREDTELDNFDWATDIVDTVNRIWDKV